jgi:hypothetical protein
MAKWQFTDVATKLPTTDPIFDDHRQEAPGEPGFTTADVAAAAGKLKGFNYVGRSDPAP